MSTTDAAPQYLLGELIGSGNFADVHRARHTYLTDHEVALKLIRPKYGLDVDALLVEAKRASALADHDNVLKVRDAGIWSDGRVFIASDLCEHGSLEDLMIDGALNPGAVCVLVSGACRGLSHVHQAGLLHLDLRPANIMLGDDDAPKLTDFGLSQWPTARAWATTTLPHAAPEFVEVGTAAITSDVYAMGMTLAHLLTGGAICRPFPDPVQLVVDSSNGDWPRLTELGGNVTARLRKVMARATDYLPWRRQPTVDEFKRELDRATPVVGLDLYEDGSMRSADERWTIEVVAARHGDQSVVVKRDGRRRGSLCLDRVDPQAAAKHVSKIVKLFAEQPPASSKC